MNPRLWIAVLCTVLAAGGCARFEPLDVRVPPSTPRIDDSRLSVGDEVEIVTLDQQRLRFRVTAFDAKAIQGANVKVATDQVKSIGVRRFGVQASRGPLPQSPEGILGAVAGAVVAVLILVAVL